MRDLPFIRSIYIEIDRAFDDARAAAAKIGDPHTAGRIEAKQRVNDQAWFLLCWGQLETAINETCREAIRSRRTSANWAIRRGWDLYNPDDSRLSGLRFEDRTASVLDKSASPSSPWAKVMSYYALRNRIAHGLLPARRIDVDEVVKEFFKIQAALQR